MVLGPPNLSELAHGLLAPSDAQAARAPRDLAHLPRLMMLSLSYGGELQMDIT